ncbi:MAG TPA: hypothetical protein VNZ52_13340 [Candidatus Thermoplasmatota archaeon]|nr:hypothetical protein [Candidatus Thermoplasmatota archaeon]
MKFRSVVLALLLAAPVLALGASANFTDNQYHEYILTNWDETNLDVIIVPPAAVNSATRLAAVEQSIDAWKSGIQAEAAPWLAQGLQINHYTLGVDAIPQSALDDPDIIVLSGEVNPFLLFGIGADWHQFVCSFVIISGSIGPVQVAPAPGAPLGTTLAPQWHQHEGSDWASTRIDCKGGTAQRCFVVNTNFAFHVDSNYRMYNLNAHEFGHCLGLGHVGDALDFKAKTFPTKDIMSYQHDTNHVFCVSTLNVRALEGIYAPHFGRPTSEWLMPGDYYHMSPTNYRNVNCPNPATRA